MKKRLTLSALFILCGIACARTRAPQELPGKAVELSQADMDQVSYTYEDVRLWAAWNAKGNKLISSAEGHLPSKDDLETALYCFHQAEIAWPKKLPDSASDERKRTHLEVPTDTLLSKGHVYLLLKEPRLAKYYYEKWREYFPGDPVVDPEIAKADAMLKTQ